MTQEQKLEQLSKLKKANKERRVKMAEKAGYTQVEDYIKFLTSLKEGKKTTVKKIFIPTIHIVDIIDRSGSMYGNKIDSASRGVFTQLEELKKIKNINYIYSLITFSSCDDIKWNIKLTPIKNCNAPFFRAHGGTALNKALGETLEIMLENVKKGEKVLVKVYTDGGENDSFGSPFRDSTILSQLIKKCESKGFTITFVGTKQDVREVIKDLKVDVTNTLAYDGSAQGYAQTMTTSLEATRSFSSKVIAKQDVSKNFYKKTGKL